MIPQTPAAPAVQNSQPAPAPEMTQDERRNKLAREVYLPVFLHTLETHYGFRPKTAAQIENLMQQAAVLRNVHEQREAARDPIDIGARKLARLMGQANPTRDHTDPRVTAFLHDVVNNDDIIKTASELFHQQAS